MPANRFYFSGELKAHSQAVLVDTEHHHLAHVMRLDAGELIELVNGQGFLAECEILKVEKKKAIISIRSVTHTPDFSLPFLLAIPLMRPSKLEWVVEKGTELGANAFLFYAADHSEKTTLSPNQMQRLHMLTIAALKQSGRLYLPSMESLPNLSSLFHRESRIFFGDPRSSHCIPKIEGNAPTVFITGPEMGFSSEEQKLLSMHATGVRLSRHTLRAETAPLAAASILGNLE